MNVQISRVEKIAGKVAVGLLALVAIGNGTVEAKQERPNILWLTLEDTSAYQFSCYGNTDIETPVIDGLAKNGLLYTKASSVAPQCSPARSTFITGCMATSYGMDYHRKAIATPDHIFFPEYLKNAGYYTVDNKKSHWNSTCKTLYKMWDSKSENATYNSDASENGKPFFAVFNFTDSHMSRFRSMTLKGRRDLTTKGIDPEKVFLPPHLPDLPEVRSDQALMLERSIEADVWVEAFLNDLQDKGLDENTIVFVFGDHGGSMPRGKGFPFETGYRVPMIVYVPEQWQEELGVVPGTVSDRLVGFEDLAPTVLELAGVVVPKAMEGVSFLGKKLEPKKYQFCFNTNQNFHFTPARTVMDGRFKYIRNYVPHKPFSLRNFFQWGMPSNLAWDTYIFSKTKKNPLWTQTFQTKPSEMLFDLDQDPWELHNLASDLKYEHKLLELKSAVKSHIRETKDLGFFPLRMRLNIEEDGGIYNWVRRVDYPLEELYKTVELASMPSASDVPELSKLLKSEHAAIRYWSAVAFSTLGSRGVISESPLELLLALEDENPDVVIAAADAVCYLDKFNEGYSSLLKLMATGDTAAYSSLEAMTWNDRLRNYMADSAGQLQEMAEGHSSEKTKQQARSILANLGKLEPLDVYTAEERKEAEKINLVIPETDFTPWIKSLSNE